tara:strand:+ start:120 stop:1103 length:984 start_codon:yes stop_codon:yes gene_type:complete
MSKAYFFAIFLLAASFTGCIGDEDLDLSEAEEETTEEDTSEEETTEEDTIDPVGSEDETGAPGVEFLGIIQDYEYFYLVAAMYDSNGFIRSYSLETTGGEGFFSDECGYGMVITENSTFTAEYDCYPLYYTSVIVDICYDLQHVNQTVTVKVEDNDGNLASNEYALTEEDFDVCDVYWGGVPTVTMFVMEDSSGLYHVDVIKVSEDLDLVDLSFFLRDDSGSTYVGGNGFGEVAMQMINGEAYGIDTSYAGDEEELIDRASNVYDDDGSEFPVHFYDYDMSGDLSPGDSFEIYGTGAEYVNGPAEDDWRLDLMFDPTGDIIGSVILM